jgi:hypothetical protein
MGIRAAQALPAGLGAQVLEVDTVMGRQTHLTLTVYKAGPPAYTADPGGARPEVRREYRLEPTADGGCRLDFHLEFDVPKRADPLVKTQLSHQVERFFDELGAIVAVRPAGTPGTLPRPCMPRRWVSGCARGICPGRHRTSITFGTSSRAVSSGEGR